MHGYFHFLYVKQKILVQSTENVHDSVFFLSIMNEYSVLRFTKS